MKNKNINKIMWSRIEEYLELEDNIPLYSKRMQIEQSIVLSKLHSKIAEIISEVHMDYVPSRFHYFRDLAAGIISLCRAFGKPFINTDYRVFLSWDGDEGETLNVVTITQDEKFKDIEPYLEVDFDCIIGYEESNHEFGLTSDRKKYVTDMVSTDVRTDFTKKVERYFDVKSEEYMHCTMHTIFSGYIIKTVKSPSGQGKGGRNNL